MQSSKTPTLPTLVANDAPDRVRCRVGEQDHPGKRHQNHLVGPERDAPERTAGEDRGVILDVIVRHQSGKTGFPKTEQNDAGERYADEQHHPNRAGQNQEPRRQARMTAQERRLSGGRLCRTLDPHERVGRGLAFGHRPLLISTIRQGLYACPPPTCRPSGKGRLCPPPPSGGVIPRRPRRPGSRSSAGHSSRGHRATPSSA